MTIIVRAARPEDAGAIAALWHAGWHDAHAGHVPDGLTAARTRAEFDARTVERIGATTLALAAEVDAEDADADDGGGEATEVAGFTTVVGDEVEQLFVGVAHRGTDVARVLLDQAERRIARAGHRRAWLAVVAGNARARRFYAQRGWRDEGDLAYDVVSGGSTYVSPCRRYAKQVSAGPDLDG